MTLDSLWARPLEIAEGTTLRVLVFVYYVPLSLLGSRIFLLATTIGARPLLGATSTILDELDTLRTPHV